MDIIQCFQGTLSHGFQGNIVYHFHLPQNCEALSISLDYDKEHFSNKETYLDQLHTLYESYHDSPISRENLLNIMDSMKTEIQLAVMIQDEFVGNVHMPGTKKEIYISKEMSSRGCLPCTDLGGKITIIVNVFQVLEDMTSYHLVVKGDYNHVEEN